MKTFYNLMRMVAQLLGWYLFTHKERTMNHAYYVINNWKGFRAVDMMLVLIILMLPLVSTAQINNTNINFHVYATQFYYPDTYNDDVGTEENIRRIIKDGSSINNSYYQQNSPFTGWAKVECEDHNNSTFISANYRLDAWEHDDDPFYEFNLNDDSPCGGGPTEAHIEPRNDSPGTPHVKSSQCHGSGEQSAKFHYTYRYSSGDAANDPLKFENIIPPNIASHSNRVNYSGTYGGTGVGATVDYTNTLQTGLHNTNREIFYTFSTSGCYEVAVRATAPSAVTRSIFLYEYSGSALSTLVASDVNGNSGTKIQTYIPSGTYAVVLETASQQVITTSVQVANASISSGGTASYSGYTITAVGYDPPQISATTASGNVTNYQWQINNDGSWVDMAGQTSLNVNPSATDLEEGVNKFRRKAFNNVCTMLVQYTNEITIELLPKNGNVEGHVYTPSGPPNGVQDITVTLTNLENIVGGPAANTLTLTDVTDNQGKFDIEQFYVGPNKTNWRLTPSYPGHGFDPADITVELGHTDPDETGLVFTDTSSFSFSGKVSHEFNSTSYGLAGASIKLNGIFKTYTDANGIYNISIPQIGNHTISVSYEDHAFDQSSITLFVDEDKTDQNFIDLTYRTLDLSLLAGCNIYAGTGNIDLIDSGNVALPIMTGGSGIFLGTIPAKPFRVVVNGFNKISSAPDKYLSGAVVAYFNLQDIRVDLSTADTTLDLIYHPAPELEVSGMPSPPACGYATPVVDQFAQIVLQIDLWDHLPGELTSVGCKLDTGTILINDYVSSPDDDPMMNTIGINSSGLNYAMVAGSPSLAPPHTKDIEVLGEDLMGRQSSSISSLLIEGFRARESTFTTASPEVPLFILRDPPGDISFAEIMQNSSVEKSFSMHSSNGGSFEAWAAAIMDIEGPDGSSSKAWGSVEGKINMGRENVTASEAVTTMSFTQSFSTSDDPDQSTIYENGDVYVGGAFNILYGVNDIIKFDRNRCEVKRDKKLMISPDTFATTYIYTHAFIRDNIIPTLKDELAGGVMDPDSIKFFQDQAAIWEQTLQRNIDLKKSAKYEKNFSFNGGAGPAGETTEVGSANTSSFEWTANLDLSIAAELGLVLGGVGAAGGFEAQFRLDWGEGESTTNTSTLTTSYTIDDDNADDFFSVDVLRDSLYSTPIFDLIAAETSCPYEPGTLPRHDAVVTFDQGLHTNIDPSAAVVVKCTIFNQSQSEDDLYYAMVFANESNPDGILINGQTNPPAWTFANPIPYNDFVVQTITITRGPGNVYAYEGLEFIVFPSCDFINPDVDEPLGRRKLSIYYTTPCTDVAITAPAQNWTSSDANSNSLDVHVADYVKANMDALSIQYAPKGTNSWSQAINIPVASLHNNPSVGSTYSWNTTNVDDGMYDLRASITCGSDIIYAERISGEIDQNYPILFGRPEPQNHTMLSGADELSMRFNENINCAKINISNVQLLNVFSGQKINVDVLCLDNEIVVEPNVDLLKLLPAPYRLIVTEIEDNFGNVNPDTILWEFTAGDYNEFTCDESTIFYVDQSAVLGKRNGLTWEDAFVDLREALETACPSSSIYIAEGVYYPWDSIPQLDVLGNVIVDPDTVYTEESYFVLTHDYNLYGGFPAGGSEFNQRNPAVYQSVISGDKNDNQTADAGDSHTLMRMNSGIASIVDGLVFEYAFADGQHFQNRYGGGVLDYSDGSHFVNCIFRGLEAVGFGSNNDGVAGAMIHFGLGEVSLTGCLFYNNHATNDGGAVSPQGGTMNIINCTFANNESNFRGGAIHNFNSTLNVSNSIFYDNAAATSHSDIFAFTPVAITINNCLFDGVLPAVTHTGANNFINTDPDFMNPVSNDYTLKSSSMAIENGDNAVVPSAVNRDLKDDVRFMDNTYTGNPIVDLGAYEHSPCAGAGGATILYVDASATPGQVGTSWAAAINTFSRALIVATSCNIDTIFVAQGVYIPDVSQFSVNREARFIIPENMKLFGGFPTGGSTVGNRDWQANETILSGDIGNPINPNDNSYTVVDISNGGENIQLDGFVVEKGNAFSNTNTHTSRGGGIYIEAVGINKTSSPTIKNCVLRNNEGKSGGAMAVVSKDAGLTNPVVEKCVFFDNESFNGGAVAELSEGDFSFITALYINSLFYDNTANKHGGAMYSIGSANGQIASRLVNCTVVDNIADNDMVGGGNGGGILTLDFTGGHVNHVYQNSIYWNNKAGLVNQQVSNLTSATSSLSHSIIQDATPGDSTLSIPNGMSDVGGNTDLAPSFVDVAGNNYRLLYGSIGIDFAEDGFNETEEDIVGASRNSGLQIDAGAYEFDYNFPCGVYPTLTIDVDPIFGGIYRAEGLINSAGRVTELSLGEVSFKSKVEILLNSEFEVKLGEEFEAVIENPCVD